MSYRKVGYLEQCFYILKYALRRDWRKILFYFLSLTWGLPLTLAGLIVALVLICTGRKPKRFGLVWYFNVGRNWGGLELGLFFLTDENDSLSTKCHEFGHGIQNCVYGFLMPFLVCIPSAIRYWYRELRYNRKGKTPPTSYDSIWFEGQATKWGKTFYKKAEEYKR